jgi:hypothetical protein
MMRFLFIVSIVLAIPVAWGADDFQSGLSAAESRNFKEAIGHFEHFLEKEPNNASALYNLGTCYLNDQQFGKAILNFERALKLHPGDEAAIEKIRISYAAIGQDKEWTPLYGIFESLCYAIGTRTWLIISILASILTALVAFQLLSGTKKFSIPLPLLVISFSTAILLFSLWSGSKASQFGNTSTFAIITKNEVNTLLNPEGEMSDVQLPQGTRLEILEKGALTMKVKDETGKDHLIFYSDAEII